MKPKSPPPTRGKIISAIQRSLEHKTQNGLGPHLPRMAAIESAEDQIRRSDSGMIVSSFLAKAGISPDELAEKRMKSVTKLNRLFEKEKKAVIKHANSLSDSLLLDIARWKRPFQTLYDDPIPTSIVYLDTAVFIVDSGFDLGVAGNASPVNNTAKVSGSWDRGVNRDSANFIFTWRNPSDKTAVVNASTLLAYNGVLIARANGGGFTWAQINVGSRLHVLEWWNMQLIICRRNSYQCSRCPFT